MMLIIEPFDTFFFRTGKGSLIGTEANISGQSIFPPPPSLWYGALRTIYFTYHPEELQFANTEKDPTLNLAIKGIFLIDLNIWEKQKSLEGALYLPTPFDVMKDKDKGSKAEIKNIRYLKLRSTLNQEKIKGDAYTNSPFIDSLALEDEDNEEQKEHIASEAAIGTWMRVIDFSQKYYAGETKDINLLTSKNFLEQEEKTGIKIDSVTRKAQEEHLYRVNYFRFKNLSKYSCGYAFALWIEGLDLPTSGFLKLGADAKPAAFWQIEQKEPNLPTIEQQSFEKFKVYLQTPAILENGYLPRYIQNPREPFEFYGLKLRLLTVATGNYVSIGGFDMKANKPKPMHRAINAGSVFYFELLEPTRENIQKVIQVFHLQCFSDLALLPQGVGTASYQGFGRSYLVPIA